MTAAPPVFAVARARPGGRFTYLTPHWPDARGYLVGLLEQHAAAAASGDVARRARAAADRVPTVPPAGTWSVQIGGCRYELVRQDVAAVPERGRAGTAHSAEWKSVKPPTPVLTADLNGVLTAPAQRRCEAARRPADLGRTTGTPPDGELAGRRESPSGEVTSMADRASYYVRRVRTVDRHPPLLRRGTPVGAVAWTGPIRGRRHAERERDAWQRTGEWAAEVVPASPQIRAQVHAWQRQRQPPSHRR